MSSLTLNSRPIHELLTNFTPTKLNLPLNILKWIPNETPLSNLKEVTYGLILYLILIFGGQYLMSERKAFSEFFTFFICDLIVFEE